MNKKGFAITSLIYGLAILGFLLITIIMSTMANTRFNSKQISEDVKEDLVNYSNASMTFNYKDGEQEFVTPDGESGWYRIEIWGAQGGGYLGGKGSYATGIIHLTEGQQLYFYVGKQGSSGVGGGETSVRVEPDDNEASKRSRIMVAGGGGSDSSSAVGSTLSRYTKSIDSNITGIENDYYVLKSSNLLGTTYSNFSSLMGNPYDYNLNHNSSAAGKGYYNGTSAIEGGTSFISGYAGSFAYSALDTNSSTPTYTQYNYSYDSNANLSYNTSTSKGSFYFYDGMMLSGVRSGNGLAKIERVVKETDDITSLPKQNTSLNNVSKIKFCLNGSDVNNYNLYAVSGGSLVRNTSSVSGNCKTFTFGNSNLDEISLISNNPTGKNISNYSVVVNDSLTLVTSNGYNRVETPDGIHISAYQPNYLSDKVSEGTYYIFPVTSDTKVISTYKNDEDVDKIIKSQELSGGLNQKWSIHAIECKLYNGNACSDVNNRYGSVSKDRIEFKIEDLIRSNTLSISLDENKFKNQITAFTPFNSLSRNDSQIWKINSLQDGTYKISSSVEKFDGINTPGGLMVATNSNDDNNNYLIISDDKSKDLARFYFYKLNF